MDACITCRRLIAADDPAAYAVATDAGVEFQCLPCGDAASVGRNGFARQGASRHGFAARVTLSLVLALGLVACGDLTVEQPKDQQAEEDGGELDGGHDEASTEERGPAAGAAEPEENNPDDQDTPPDDVAVQVDVNVEVTVAAADGSRRPIDDVRYSSVERTWAEVVRRAPEGYRLATRSELFALIDAGVLDDQVGGDPIVWSATERDERRAYFVDWSGLTAVMDKSSTLSAVYVRDDGEAAE